MLSRLRTRTKCYYNLDRHEIRNSISKNDYNIARKYHATKRKEIIPIVVGIAALTVITRYSYRAIQHMEEEWDEYEKELKLYSKEQIKETRKKCYKDGFVGIDVGTIN